MSSLIITPIDIDSLTSSTTTKMKEQTIYLVVIAICTKILSFLQINFWMIPAEKQIVLIRKNLFRAILRQEISWFDMNKSGELQNRLNDDVNKIKIGIGDKFGSTIQFSSAFLTGTIIAFYRGWKLTLVILSLFPVFMAVGYGFSKISAYLSTNELKSYAKAGYICEEVLSSIRTVFAFNGAPKEHERYEKELEVARKFGIKKSTITGIMLGIVWLLVNSTFGLSFWYGWTLTKRSPLNNCLSELTIGEIMLVFFSLILAVFSLGQAAPFMEKLAEAKSAAYEIFKIIDRVPEMDIESESGIILDNINGDISFKNVKFNYPSRNETTVLSDLNINIDSGKTIALVGSSGCGKSTCIQLIQRFYDPLYGQITIDGTNIKDLNLNWLRSQLGVVNQEPILFDTTIANNIRFGTSQENVTLQEIEEAAKKANAHDFIIKLPKKYETIVGSRGSQLSGGQKQRIAIARALIKNPKILLLDEATSALDNESEAIVQSALDKASQGRTTIIVAHRLSTIRNADKIYVIDKGEVVESGTHDELMTKMGHYYGLVCLQQTSQSSVKISDEENSTKLEFFDEKISNNSNVESSPTIEKIFSSNDLKEKKFSLKDILKLNKPEYIYILFGSLSSLVSGAIMPAFAIVMSKLIAVFRECDYELQKTLVTKYCLLFFGFGLILLVSYFFQGLMLGISGENLTKRLRSNVFKSMLSQEVSWFDQPNNSVGTLCTRLSTEAAAVKGTTGHSIGFLMLNIGNLGIGIGLSFGYSWPVTFLVLGFIPLIAASAVLQSKLIGGFSIKDKGALEEAGKLASEGISHARTVTMLNVQKKFNEFYSDKLDLPYKASIRSSILYAIMYGFTNSIMLYAIAASFSLGAYLIDNKIFNSDITDILVVFNCITFGAQSAGTASTFMPDVGKARIAAYEILDFLARKSKINNFESKNGEKLDMDSFSGTIEFLSVNFTYPTRPNVPVLEDFSLKIKSGERVALVGSSGCGKSTITQLIERFYDCSNGEIQIDNRSLKDIDLFSLRSKLGIVSQEPILFDATITENIAYGDQTRSVSQNEIEDAAKKANIHEFISKLPEGYQTNVGSKGTQLSGGQKQRIAIARALIRNPKILLLDEATSALDTESEKIVQDALDKAQEGRTCIIIAHRLSTIQNSDKIIVIKDGKIVEIGKHEQLLSYNGVYSKLYNQK